MKIYREWGSSNREVASFYSFCLKYFCVQSGEVEGPYRAYFTDLLAYLDGKEEYFYKDGGFEPTKPVYEKASMSQILRVIIEELKDRWEMVCMSYASCRKKFLK